MISTIQNFQIPVDNFERAHQFYSRLMEYELQILETPEFTLGIFQFEQEKGVGGCIIQSKELTPSKQGTMVYFHAGPDLQPFLQRSTLAGGTVFVEKTPLGPEMGFYGIIDDTEGNRIGLYSDQ
jgi:predicted enzyme related to lactoylglutathione lyase